MRRWWSLAAVAAIAGCASDGGTPGEIDYARIRAHVEALADDSMEGRGAGYEGERRAANYIAREFSAVGLAAPAGGYIRPFDFLPVGGVTPMATLEARNIVGVLKGSSRANEIVVVGAHFDGQGKIGEAEEGRFGVEAAGDDKIWNSASDNAVSIGAMIEIARVLRHGPRLARTIVFVAFSGEENRLNGSFDYVRNPVAPLDSHVAMVNLEKLVGHEETTLILASDGSSAGFADFAGAAAAQSGLNVQSFFDGVITDTDHFSFIAAGVPALVIGTGAYEKIHHADDTSATLRYDDLPPRLDYVRAFVTALANDAAPLPFAADMEAYSGVAGGPTTEAESRFCGLLTPGFLVTVLARGLPAERSGLNVGDVIIGVDGAPIAFGEEGANFLEEAATLGPASKLELRCGGKASSVILEMPSGVEASSAVSQ